MTHPEGSSKRYWTRLARQAGQGKDRSKARKRRKKRK